MATSAPGRHSFWVGQRVPAVGPVAMVVRAMRGQSLPLALPLGIIDLILEELDPPESFRSHWPKYSNWRWGDLLSCCLVTKGFLAAARRRLYRKVVVLVEPREHCRNPGDYEEDEFQGRNEEEILTTNSKRLELTLRCAPQLAALVRRVELTFVCDRPNLVPAIHSPALALGTILHACLNVQRVQINTTDFGSRVGLREEELLPLTSILSVAGTSIRKLVFIYVVPRSAQSGEAITSLLATLPQLTSLRVQGGILCGSKTTSPTSLTSLDVSTVGDGDFGRFPYSEFLILASPSALSLRSLTIITTGDYGNLLLNTFPNLESLK